MTPSHAIEEAPPKRPLQSVRKFYFLDYFYILLESVEKHSKEEDIFSSFKLLKQKHRLGESKYKKLTNDGADLTHVQQQRYRYTFKQVVEESKDFGLIKEDENRYLYITQSGSKLLRLYYERGLLAFNRSLFRVMEDCYQAYRELIPFIFSANPNRSGVLIFPHYSPLELNFVRSEVQTTGDIVRYTKELVRKLQNDIDQYLQRNVDLESTNGQLLTKLKEDRLLPRENSDRFQSSDYNKITKRIRDFWIIYFLSELYGCKFTMSTFELWIYRAKQVGIIHATETYPSINGKLVFPTSVILHEKATKDFVSIHRYSSGETLYVHEPNRSGFRDEFVNALVRSYFDLRRVNRNYFVNLISLRELVCYSLKISAHFFEQMLQDIYRLNLLGELRIRISLEVDRLPEETTAMYMKSEPVMIDGSYRNIIAIDVTKGETRK